MANDVSSNSAAARRVASASAPIAATQCWPAQPRGRSAASPRVGHAGPAAFDSNQFGRSQPDFSPKTAPSPAGAGRRATGGAAGRPGAPRSGSGCRSRWRSSRWCAPGCTTGSGSGRRSGGCPSARDRAPARPRRSTPPPGGRCRPPRRCRGRRSRPPRRSPRTSLSPRMNSLSGVNASGPLIMRLTPASTRWPGRAGSRRS